MWDAVTSAPALALACLLLTALYHLLLLRSRSGCKLSTFWFIVCLTANALRPRPSSAPHPPPPCPPSPDVTRSRDSMLRLIRLAAPLMSPAQQPAALRRVPATVAGVRVRW